MSLRNTFFKTAYRTIENHNRLPNDRIRLPNGRNRLLNDRTIIINRYSIMGKYEALNWCQYMYEILLDFVYNCNTFNHRLYYVTLRSIDNLWFNYK